MGSPRVIGNPNHPLVKAMRAYKQETPGIAFEGPMGSYNGYAPLREQLEFACKVGAAWAQLWHRDIIHEEYQDTPRKYRWRFQRKSDE